jgi:hypothetical protein
MLSEQTPLPPGNRCPKSSVSRLKSRNSFACNTVLPRLYHCKPGTFERKCQGTGEPIRSNGV